MLVGVRRALAISEINSNKSQTNSRVWIFGISCSGSARNAKRGGRALPKGPGVGRGGARPSPRTHNTNTKDKERERESDDECLNACSTNKMESPPLTRAAPQNKRPRGPRSAPKPSTAPTGPLPPSHAPPGAVGGAAAPRRHFKRDPRDTKIPAEGPALGPRGAHGHPGCVRRLPACPRGAKIERPPRNLERRFKGLGTRRGC